MRGSNRTALATSTSARFLIVAIIEIPPILWTEREAAEVRRIAATRELLIDVPSDWTGSIVKAANAASAPPRAAPPRSCGIVDFSPGITIALNCSAFISAPKQGLLIEPPFYTCHFFLTAPFV